MNGSIHLNLSSFFTVILFNNFQLQVMSYPSLEKVWTMGASIIKVVYFYLFREFKIFSLNFSKTYGWKNLPFRAILECSSFCLWFSVDDRTKLYIHLFSDKYAFPYFLQATCSILQGTVSQGTRRYIPLSFICIKYLREEYILYELIPKLKITSLNLEFWILNRGYGQENSSETYRYGNEIGFGMSSMRSIE